MMLSKLDLLYYALDGATALHRSRDIDEIKRRIKLVLIAAKRKKEQS